MTTVYITHMILSFVLFVCLLAFAVVAPIWITPGYYWWTSFAILLLLGQSFVFTDRLTGWDRNDT